VSKAIRRVRRYVRCPAIAGEAGTPHKPPTTIIYNQWSHQQPVHRLGPAHRLGADSVDRERAKRFLKKKTPPSIGSSRCSDSLAGPLYRLRLILLTAKTKKR
jgi:hypothetical protein